MTSEGQQAGQQPAEATSGGAAEPFGSDGFPPDSDGQGRASSPSAANPSAASFPVSYAPPPQSTPNGGSPFVVPTVFGQPSAERPFPDAPANRYGIPTAQPGQASTPDPADRTTPPPFAPPSSGFGPPPSADFGPPSADFGPPAATGPAAGSARVTGSGSARVPGSSSALPQRTASAGSASVPARDNGSGPVPPPSAWAPPPVPRTGQSAADDPFGRPYRTGIDDSDNPLGGPSGEIAGFAPGSPTRARAGLDDSDFGDSSSESHAAPVRRPASAIGAAFDRSGALPGRLGPSADRSGTEAGQPGPESETDGRPLGVSAFGDQRVRVPGATLTDLPDGPPSGRAVGGGLGALPRRGADQSDGSAPPRQPGSGLPVRGRSPFGANGDGPAGSRAVGSPPDSFAAFRPSGESSRSPSDSSREPVPDTERAAGSGSPFDNLPSRGTRLPQRSTSDASFGAPAGGSPFEGRPADLSQFSAQLPGESPFERQPSHESPFGAQPSSESPYGAQPPSESPYGAQPPSESPFGRQPPSGSPFAAGAPSGTDFGAPSGSRFGPEGDGPFGNRPPSGSPFDGHASSNAPVADRPMSDIPSGDRPFAGGYGSGERPFDPPSVDRPSAGERGGGEHPYGPPPAAPYLGPPAFGEPSSAGSSFGDPSSAGSVFGTPASSGSPFAGASFAADNAPAAAAEPRNGPVPQPRDPADRPAVGTARPVSASASVPAASRVTPTDAEEIPPPSAVPQARVYGRATQPTDTTGDDEPMYAWPPRDDQEVPGTSPVSPFPRRPEDDHAGPARFGATPVSPYSHQAGPDARPVSPYADQAGPDARPVSPYADRAGPGAFGAAPVSPYSRPASDGTGPASPFTGRPEDGSGPVPLPARRPESPTGPYGRRPQDDQNGPGAAPEAQPPAAAPQSPGRVSGRATASARVTPPPAPAQPGPPFTEFTDDVAGRGAAKAPATYNENTTDIAHRSQSPDQAYVPAPALPSMHARPPLENGFPPPPDADAPDRRLGGVFPGPASRSTVTPPPSPEGTTSWPTPGGSEQGRFDQFKPDTEAATPGTPHVRMLPVLLSVIIGAVLLVGLAIGIVWLISRGSDSSGFSVNAGDCVKRSGQEAVKATCGDAGAFQVVSIADTKEQCADPGQPYVLNPTKDGKTQVLCLKPTN